MKWHMIHVESREKRSDVSTSEAVSFLKGLTAKERAYWYVWKEGFADWIPSSECRELVPVRLELVKSSLTVNDSGSTERRKNPRVAIKLRVVVVSGTKSFRSFSKDISLGGLLLAKHLPESFRDADLCKIFIASLDGREHVEFSAQLIRNPEQPLRVAFCFKEETASARETLATWLGTASPKLKIAA